MMRPTRVEIDRSALKHNLEYLKKLNGPQTFFCPMVKANAYGHGDKIVARSVQEVGASALGVALFEEGLALREARIQMPILVFATLDRVAASAALTHQLTPVLGRLEDLSALSEVCGKSRLGIHLLFNTGMNRMGFGESELPELRRKLQECPALVVEGVCTHFTHGEEAHQPEGYTQKQVTRFQKMSEGFPGIRHCHKSASLISLAKHGLTKDPQVGSRPGIAIYGLGFDTSALRPVLRWTTHLLRAHFLEKGESVGYSARWVAPRKSVVGVIPVGYGDGYLRALGGKGEMLFRQTRVPVVGTVCMDYIILDLTDAVQEGLPQPGEDVVLIGQQGRENISAAWLAERAGTIDYEIVTAIGQRVPREVI